MQKIDIDYSLKNIPLQTKKSYQMDLVKNLQNLCWRIRWKALKGWGCFDNPRTGARPTRKETYGFKSAKTPKLPIDAEYPHIDWGKVKPEVEILKEFEEELFKVPTRHRITYLPYSIHLGKNINVKSHSKVRSLQSEVYKCASIL